MGRRLALICLPVMMAWLGLSSPALAAPQSPAGQPQSRATAQPPTTGNLLVLLDRGHSRAAAGSAAVDRLVARLGARFAGRSVPQIGLVTVRPPGGIPLTAFARLLSRLPGVASVQVERRYKPRLVPNDPALAEVDPSDGVPWQWYLAREDLYAAWSVARGDGGLVGVIDTGVDASHPDLAGKIAAAIDQQAPAYSTGPPTTDQVGHGTHVASLACAATGNAVGIAGTGYDCRLLVEKTDFTDSSIAASIVDAADRGADALNMSFGPSSPTSAPAPDSEVRALNYAASHKVVLVAAAADNAVTEQGDPANVLQPAGTGPDINAGLGLDVTAADYLGARADFAGYGNEISLAAFGSFDPNGGGLLGCSGQPVGILGAFPGNHTPMEGGLAPSACRVTLDGDPRYATIAGTSMAAPQVAAVGAMLRVLNPYATLQEILRAIKSSAQRAPGTGWTNDLGWGGLDAGAAVDVVRRIDHLAPVSTLSTPRRSRSRRFRLRWSGHDQQHPGLIASGVAYYDVYVKVGKHWRMLKRTTGATLRFRGRRGRRYTFEVVAVDHAGNRQTHPAVSSTRVNRRSR